MEKEDYDELEERLIRSLIPWMYDVGPKPSMQVVLDNMWNRIFELQKDITVGDILNEIERLE